MSQPTDQNDSSEREDSEREDESPIEFIPTIESPGPPDNPYAQMVESIDFYCCRPFLVSAYLRFVADTELVAFLTAAMSCRIYVYGHHDWIRGKKVQVIVRIIKVLDYLIAESSKSLSYRSDSLNSFSREASYRYWFAAKGVKDTFRWYREFFDERTEAEVLDGMRHVDRAEHHCEGCDISHTIDIWLKSP